MSIKRLIVCSALSLTGMVSATRQLDPVEIHGRVAKLQAEIEEGWESIVKKPFNTEVILATIDNCLSNHLLICVLQNTVTPRKEALEKTNDLISSLLHKIEEPAATLLALRDKKTSLTLELAELEQSRALVLQTVLPPAAPVQEFTDILVYHRESRRTLGVKHNAHWVCKGTQRQPVGVKAIYYGQDGQRTVSYDGNPPYE